MAGPGTVGGGAITGAAIPQINPAQQKDLQTAIGRHVGSSMETRLVTRLFCVWLAGKMRWNADQVAEFLGGIPTQEGINQYLAIYNSQGLEGLERELPTETNFYNRSGGGQR